MARKKGQKPSNKNWIILLGLICAVFVYWQWGTAPNQTQTEYKSHKQVVTEQTSNVKLSWIDGVINSVEQTIDNIKLSMPTFDDNSSVNEEVEASNDNNVYEVEYSEISKQQEEGVSPIDKIKELFSKQKKDKSVVKSENKKNEDKIEKDIKKEKNKTVKTETKEKAIVPKKQVKTKHIQRQGKAKMAILLDDFGYGNHNLKIYNSLPIPLTYAILPYHTYSTEAAETGYAAGKEIMVHLPMESISNVTPEAITLRTTMGNDEIYSVASKAIKSVPHAVGINNHQGSKASADRRVVGIVMGIIKRRNMFFFDSRTTAKSVILSMVREKGVPTGTNDLFLDNDSSVAAIEGRLQQAANMAFNSKDKYIIVIGHDRPNTAKAIANMYHKLQEEGIEFVFLRSLLY